MYQGESIVAMPRGNNVIMPPSGRPKGLGRRNPHNGKFTRKRFKAVDERHADKNALAISEGLNKISLFFTGQKSMIKKPVINNSNPFKNMMDSILNRKG